jgi:hypothetical protein
MKLIRLTLSTDHTWWVCVDHIVTITEAKFVCGNRARSRVLLTNGHYTDVAETPDDILQLWAKTESQ